MSLAIEFVLFFIVVYLLVPGMVISAFIMRGAICQARGSAAWKKRLSPESGG